MITNKDEEILNHVEMEIKRSHIDIIDYMNKHFTQEERDKHGVNIVNMLPEMSIGAHIKMKILAKIIK
jgi:hypothetical protein